MSGNIVVIKMSDGNTVNLFKVDQDYTEVTIDAEAAALVAAHHPSETVSGWAACEDTVLEDCMGAGNDLDSDFFVKQKQSVLVSETIIPPDGMVEDDLAPTDDCVCYTT